MTHFFLSLTTGFTAFVATNLDDIIILLLFFSQVNAAFRRQHIIFGQYLGFFALVLASLPGFFSSFLLPRPWIGLLGIVPIVVGLSRLLGIQAVSSEVETVSDEVKIEPQIVSWWPGFLSPQACSVAAVTFANGGDNVGIYVPLFAHSTVEELIGILGIFFSLVGVWCYSAWRLTRIPIFAEKLARYGNYLVPFVLMGLGFLILVDSHTLENRGLATLALTLSGLSILMLSHSYGSRSTSLSMVSSSHEDI